MNRNARNRGIQLPHLVGFEAAMTEFWAILFKAVIPKLALKQSARPANSANVASNRANSSWARLARFAANLAHTAW